MGKVISMFSRREVSQPREVPSLVDFFAESSFSERSWMNTVLRITVRDVDQVLGLLHYPFGFNEMGVHPFDPGEYDVRDTEAVIAVRALSEAPQDEYSGWKLECGFYVCAGGDWYFKREAGGNFERERRGQRLFLKANPNKYPNEE